MKNLDTAFALHFSPALPLSWLVAAGIAGLILLTLGFLGNGRGLVLRILTFGVFMLALINPSLLEQQREAVKDVAVIVVDQSQSQKMGEREERRDNALEALQKKLVKHDDLELRIVKAPSSKEIQKDTRLFDALDLAMSDVPQKRRAGVIFLTDGQIHDVPQDSALFEKYGPVHGLLTGDKRERDRQLVILKAPAYGIVGQKISIQYKVEDTDSASQSNATVTLKRHDGKPEVFFVPVGEEQTLEVDIEHAGQNVLELSVEAIPKEITLDNNRAALLVNGVRDRLRVLLVSGQPHAGGRTWRDLLTSDPGVDLVHFTILREPDKLDSTPQNELSLIAFPFRELFEIKLYDFDLIIFDRYRLNRILPSNYFNNIVRYIEEGGALLEASGPSFASQDSVYYTSLMNVLPGIPTGAIIRKPFIPSLTEGGKKHPVTKDIYWNGILQNNEPNWGHWLRQVVIKRDKGETLMDGADGYPLLVLDRVKEGRVAQLSSDHIWLWSRGYESGGPHADLLRRVVHWLMKEPELDEKALDVEIDNNIITVRSRNYKQSGMNITITKPDGTTEIIKLEQDKDGWLEKRIEADQLGVFSFEDPDGQRRFAIIGDLNPPELKGVRTTPDLLAPLAEASKGSIKWLSDNTSPSIRLLPEGRNYAGHNWIGLRRNHDFNVTGVKDRPLLPPWLAALILLGLATFTWWREGQTK
ncbi:MAG: hypothetical protein DHS20C02_01780 [Micavibrio sp.]|nr:MAG: hypothetical protein DHS20C02_01780 [Micavibrio sp.]